MHLLIENNVLYVDNHLYCHAGAGNGRPHIPAGRYAVAIEYAHVHGETLLDAIGCGWIGASPECDIVLGGVRNRDGVIPSKTAFGRVMHRVEVAIEQDGKDVLLEVR